MGPQIVLRKDEALARRERQPFDCLVPVRLDAAPFGTADPQVVLAERIALRGALANPLHRLGDILAHAAVFNSNQAEARLRAGVSLLGRFSLPAQRSRIVGCGVLPGKVHAAKRALCRRVTPLGGMAQQTISFIPVTAT